MLSGMTDASPSASLGLERLGARPLLGHATQMCYAVLPILAFAGAQDMTLSQHSLWPVFGAHSLPVLSSHHSPSLSSSSCIVDRGIVKL